jgi:hypothetical protein
MIAIVENDKVTYRGNIPGTFVIGGKLKTGLQNLVVPSDAAKVLCIFPLEIIKPEFNATTHKLDGFIDDIQKDKVVQTYIVREKTQAELDAYQESIYRQKIEAEKEKLAIESLKLKEELPQDYKE